MSIDFFYFFCYTDYMLTASVVIYNTKKEQLNALLKSVLDSNCVDRLFVIDNAPSQENSSITKVSPIIEYIPHTNTGYGNSHNIALKKSIELNADYHVVLNPDIRFEKDVLKKLIRFMEENKDAVYVLPKVIYPDGEIQYLCKLLPVPSDLFLRRFLPKTKFSIKKNDRYVLKNSGYDKIINPPCLSGCFMFMRCSALKENDIFFDDRFFMYFEDFDLIRRLHRIGKTYFYPQVSVIHDHARESYKNKKMLKIHIQSAIKYFNKYGWFFDKERTLMNNQILHEIEELNP